ncbi:MAG: hypothetical protein PVI21_02020 [Candidatus Woesebacteria bacterium]|jgi:hypothetical protein
MAFERFSNFNSRSGKSYANITRNYAINFSSGFGEENGIAKFKYAVLYFDKKDCAIGVKFTNNATEEAKFVAGKKQASSGVTVIARSFFKKYDIDLEKYDKIRYAPYKTKLRDIGIDEPGIMYVIKLEERG